MKTNHDIKLGVSLYSYQDNYYFRRFDLEGCVAAAAGAGAEGVEVFSDAMIDEWPYVSDAFVDRWYGMMNRYGVNPVCLDHFSDRAMWHDRQLTDDEMYERGVMYIKLAARLGCPAIRLLHEEHIGTGISPYRLTTAAIAERLLPVCAEYNVKMALECHSPTNVADPIHEPYLEAADRLGLPYVGLQADFSSYEYCTSTADITLMVHHGFDADFLNEVRDAQRRAYAKKQPFDAGEFMPRIEKMNLNAGQKRELMRAVFVKGPYCEDKNFSYETLKDYASKLIYVHGKFYDIDENGQVDNMDYPAIFDALKAGGYKGYICSEFEGNRRMNVNGWVDEIEYVRKHHELMRKCLGYNDYPEI
ncbi:MAG: TIM barrel protein [Clostridiales bacterium]|nr:TIM barrel protein [Clostridiales bacterium]